MPQQQVLLSHCVVLKYQQNKYEFTSTPRPLFLVVVICVQFWCAVRQLIGALKARRFVVNEVRRCFGPRGVECGDCHYFVYLAHLVLAHEAFKAGDQLFHLLLIGETLQQSISAVNNAHLEQEAALCCRA